MDKLTPKEKKQINRDIEPLLRSIYFEEIPLSDIWIALRINGVVVLQEDQTEWSGLLLGQEGHEYFDLARNTQELFEGRYLHIIDNCKLSLSWYKMASGRYEVLAYVA